MFNDDEDDDDFLSQFFSESEIREIVERERAKSMNYAMETLEEWGSKYWSEAFPFPERLNVVLNNMLAYFLDLEEFEKCALIRDTINYCKQLKSENEQI